jgi:hypothetical protein
MQQPSVSRAIPMGIIGFILGVLLVILIRALQQVDPVWSPGVAIVMGTLNSAIFFIIGIGGLDPRWSVIEEDHEAEAHAETALAEVKAKAPAAEQDGDFGGSFWQITTWLIISLIVVALFMALGPRLIITQVPEASTAAVGFVEMELFGQTYQVSQLTLLVAFIVITLGSLVIAAIGLAALFGFFARGVKEVQVEAAAAKSGAALPAPAQASPPAGGGRLRQIRSGVVFVVTFVILYLVFYYVAIGLIFPNNPLLVPLSLVNALIFTLLILRTQWVLNSIGQVARWLLRVLGGLPGVLQK